LLFLQGKRKILFKISLFVFIFVSNLSDFCLNRLTVFVALGTITVVTPWFGVAAIPIIYIYVKVLNYFREVSRETKRLESISRSPVFAHFSETLGGIETISAYNQTSRFINDFECKVDSNTQGTYNNKAADRWLSARLELLGSFIAGLASIFACSVVINGTASVTAGNSKNFASVAGLSLNYAITITGLLNWTVRSFAIMEATMNAAERILFYTEEILQEAPGRCKDLNLLTQSTSSKVDNHNLFPSNLAIRAMGTAENLNPDWPSKGKITLKNLKMRYRPQNPLVLRGLNVEIEGGTRVGVVGRTGSGKSSLLLTLLRIVEPTLPDNEEYEAPITIDDIDILRIGLTDLRSAVGIIPQNPVLFSGTIRSNMDPFNEYTDKDIWNSLEGCGMKNTIEEMPTLLEAPVAEYGNNLSQGQRQLLCLGRALLKHCRILLLDEATSSVDFETDKEIQRTLRKAFAGCTVLTIAHRVNTIMDSDQILVMVDGKASEFAPPEELLADKNSIFAEIVKHSGTE
jgi:ABC-type multidrug transport system fused ATPase/permease subunit